MQRVGEALVNNEQMEADQRGHSTGDEQAGEDSVVLRGHLPAVAGGFQ